MDKMQECQGCKKLQALYKTSHASGVSLGTRTSDAEIKQLRQYISQFDTTFKEQRETFMKEMTDALQEAEDRADYWQMKYESVT